MKKRIWELDALRGLCILGVVAVHFVYDIVELYRLVKWNYPQWFTLLKDWGGIIFLLISGICVTLGSRCMRRGLLVFLCGMVCTAVTWGMVALGLAGPGMIIWFGVLHCLGICMLLWPLFSRMKPWLLALLGMLAAAVGLYLFSFVRLDTDVFIPLGLFSSNFATPDYFPIFPYLGFFLLGAALGKTVYKNKTSLFPNVNPKNPIIAFFAMLGRHSLWIYLLHQPVLSAICYVLS